MRLSAYAFGVAIASLCTFNAPSAQAWERAGNLDTTCKVLADELAKHIEPLSDKSVSCLNYFSGAGDALLPHIGEFATNRCLFNKYMNLDDLRNPQIFVEYMRNHPEIDADERAIIVIRKSLEDACKDKP